MKFKVGMYELNPNANFNFQLNRLINWDAGELEEVLEVSAGIRTNSDWKRILIGLGDRAFREGRKETAVGYYRMSEFFMSEEDEDKIRYYRLATDLFYELYEEYFSSGRVERKEVPFGQALLPVLYAKGSAPARGSILFHGGNDSYFEELFFPMLYLAQSGYDVYLFEGPGQGGVLRERGLKFTPEWEKPVGAVLDHFHLDDAVIVGVSLGGMLAPRAAAFEKRIRAVVAWSVFPDFLTIALHDLPKPMKILFRGLMYFRLRKITDALVRSKMKKDVFLQWVFHHGMYAYGAESPYEYLRKLGDFQMMNVADRIKQDMLILHGKEDHFIHWKLYREELNALENAKSITFRLFTGKEQASNHCQCGNTRLALDTIIGWLDTLDRRLSE